MPIRNAISIRWAGSPAEIIELGMFFAKNAVRLPNYISHGEIQLALSRDGETWSADARELIADYFERLSRGELSDQVAGAWDARIPVGVAVVEIADNATCKYAILADIFVDPTARRTGIGKRMLQFIEADLRERGVAWLFLESGVKNKAAHRFFQRLGYKETSRVFAKRFGGEGS